MINLRNGIIKKEVPENENSCKIIDIVGKVFVFNKQQIRRGLKILRPKQMRQRLIIALAKVKADSKSENLLIKICQIIYSLYRAKKNY